MPDANGKFQLQDYVSELEKRGFDGWEDADLKTLVNRGYFHVARKFPLNWQETSDALSLTPGQYSIDVWPTASGELPYLRQLDRLYVTSPAAYRGKLKPLTDDQFFEGYLPLDLDSTSMRGRPTGYFIHEGKLWILRPTDQALTLTARYHRRLAAMVNDTDQPLTPQHMDEAILVAALIRCHKRANEIGLAQMNEVELQDFFDDALDDEEMRLAEQPDRVRADDTWA